jgi:DNA-directed RNA polymerase specialized sigma24 family protein
VLRRVGRRLADVGDLLSVTDSDKAVLLGLYEEKRANLVRFFAARLGSRAEAEDLVQDLFLRISGMDALGPVDNPSALLHRIGSNLMLDRLRSQKRSGTRDSDWRSVNTTVVAGQEVADEPAADEVVAGRQRLCRRWSRRSRTCRKRPARLSSCTSWKATATWRPRAAWASASARWKST